MLENFIILKNLSVDVLDELKVICELKKFKPGESLIKENEQSTEIYFPISGKLNYLKYDDEFQKEIKFHEMTAGDGISVGEMSFIDDSPRSCSIYAADGSDVVAYVLSFSKLQEKSQHAKEIEQALRQQVTVQISNHLRDLNSQHVGALKDQIKQLKEKNYSGVVFIGFALMLGFTSLIAKMVTELFPDYVIGTSPIVSWIFVGLMLVPAIILMRTFKIKLEEMGVTRKKLVPSLIDGVVFTLLILLVIFGILWVIDLFKPEAQAVTNFIKIVLSVNIVLSLQYLPNSFLQEFVIRGMGQNAIQKFFGDKRGFWAVLLTAVFFSIAHIPFGLAAVVVTFIGNIVLGLIYLRTRNLAGITIIHYVFGGLLFSAGALTDA